MSRQIKDGYISNHGNETMNTWSLKASMLMTERNFNQKIDVRRISRPGMDEGDLIYLTDVPDSYVTITRFGRF